MFKVRRTDMEARESRFIVDALNVIRERSNGSEFSWERYCSDVKSVLDSRFGTEWNVMIGKSVGYAMKARKKSSLVAANSEGDVLVCWKSPGFEIEDSDVVKTKAQILVDERDILLQQSEGNRSSALNIVKQPSVDSPGYTTDTPEGTIIYPRAPSIFSFPVIRLLNAVLPLIADKDHQEAARIVRTHLTARFGTIWHVTVGTTQEFHVYPSRGSTDHIVAALEKGGRKIEVFRHKLASPSGLKAIGLSVPSVTTLIDVLPKILFFIMCLAFIVQRSALCQTSDSGGRMNKLTYGVCWVSFAIPLTPLAGGLFVLTMLKQVKNSLDKKKMKSRKSE